MRCVYYDDKMPNGFEENFDYSREAPYTIRIKRFQSEDIVPMHYAKTLEVLICDNLRGQVIIDKHRYDLKGKQVFVIPPYTVHSNSIHCCDGTQYVFKVSFSKLQYYLHIPNILESIGCSLDQLAYVCPDYEGVWKIISALIEQDGNQCTCLSLILQIFDIFSRYRDAGRETNRDTSRLNAGSLQELINWTQQNYMNKITLDEVAKMMGYSKYYFCSRFKTLTGITYLNYLNSVRVSNACLRLQDGQSVQKVCADCGFDNVSYFIQVFKKVQHMTPHQYAAQHRAAENNRRK